MCTHVLYLQTARARVGEEGGGAKEGGGVPSVVSGLTACVGELQS